MGMSASQARFLHLTAKKSDLEYQGQQINQQRLNLANQSASLYNEMLQISVPTPPSVTDYTKNVYSFVDGAENKDIISLSKKLDNDNGYSYKISYSEMAKNAIVTPSQDLENIDFKIVFPPDRFQTISEYIPKTAQSIPITDYYYDTNNLTLETDYEGDNSSQSINLGQRYIVDNSIVDNNYELTQQAQYSRASVDASLIDYKVEGEYYQLSGQSFIVSNQPTYTIADMSDSYNNNPILKTSTDPVNVTLLSNDEKNEAGFQQDDYVYKKQDPEILKAMTTYYVVKPNKTIDKLIRLSENINIDDYGNLYSKLSYDQVPKNSYFKEILTDNPSCSIFKNNDKYYDNRQEIILPSVKSLGNLANTGNLGLQSESYSLPSLTTMQTSIEGSWFPLNNSSIKMQSLQDDDDPVKTFVSSTDTANMKFFYDEDDNGEKTYYIDDGHSLCHYGKIDNKNVTFVYSEDLENAFEILSNKHFNPENMAFLTTIDDNDEKQYYLYSLEDNQLSQLNLGDIETLNLVNISESESIPYLIQQALTLGSSVYYDETNKSYYKSIPENNVAKISSFQIDGKDCQVLNNFCADPSLKIFLGLLTDEQKLNRDFYYNVDDITGEYSYYSIERSTGEVNSYTSGSITASNISISSYQPNIDYSFSNNRILTTTNHFKIDNQDAIKVEDVTSLPQKLQDKLSQLNEDKNESNKSYVYKTGLAPDLKYYIVDSNNNAQQYYEAASTKLTINGEAMSIVDPSNLPQSIASESDDYDFYKLNNDTSSYIAIDKATQEFWAVLVNNVIKGNIVTQVFNDSENAELFSQIENYVPSSSVYVARNGDGNQTYYLSTNQANYYKQLRSQEVIDNNYVNKVNGEASGSGTFSYKGISYTANQKIYYKGSQNSEDYRLYVVNADSGTVLKSYKPNVITQINGEEATLINKEQYPQGLTASDEETVYSQVQQDGEIVYFKVSSNNNNAIELEKSVYDKNIGPNPEEKKQYLINGNSATLMEDDKIPNGLVYDKNTQNVFYVVEDDILTYYIVAKNQEAGTISKVKTYQDLGQYNYDPDTLLTKISDANIITNSNGQITSIDIEGLGSFSLTVSQVQDENAYNEAMVKYEYEKSVYDKTLEDINAKTAILQQQDKTLELQLKQIDTSHSAIETEIDTIKNVLKNNLEKSFNVFS